MTESKSPLTVIVLLSVLFPLLAGLVLYWFWGQETWVNEPVHSSIESAGSLVAIVLGLLLLAQSHFEDLSDHFVWLAAALFAMGILDGFHALIHVSSSFFWTRALATFFGGLLFTLVWLPAGAAQTRIARAFPWIVLLLSGVLGAVLDFFPETLPLSFSADGTFTWTARAFNIVGGIGYFLAALRLIRDREGRNADENIIFASQCLMLGVAGALFAIGKMWSPVWWLFHFLRFFSYLVVLRYVFLSYVQIQRRVLSSNTELLNSNRELNIANQELEAFCYSVSHDLRAPLRGIDGFSQALSEDYESVLDKDGKRYLAFIREGVQRMGQLIDDLLNLSRYTRAELQLQWVDLSGLARNIGEHLASENLLVKKDFDIQDKVVAMADLGLINVVLENLLSNAWKFTKPRALARIKFGSEEQNGERVFFVRDNGAGFDMAYSKKLFGAFQRLHTQSEFPGTGIGLATVRRIIQRHGGRVWATGKPGEGATFYFTLPAASS